MRKIKQVSEQKQLVADADASAQVMSRQGCGQVQHLLAHDVCAHHNVHLHCASVTSVFVFGTVTQLANTIDEERRQHGDAVAALVSGAACVT